MDDLNIRKAGRAGRITLTRPKALNALSHDMAVAVLAALDGWRDDPDVALVILDAEGDRAFCAGGDIAAVYRAGLAGDHAVGHSGERPRDRRRSERPHRIPGGAPLGQRHIVGPARGGLGAERPRQAPPGGDAARTGPEAG